MAALTIDQILSRANTLANQVAAAGVHAEQISMVLVHLKRHPDVAASLTLIAELRRSSFAHRTNSTPAQLRALEESVRRAIQGLTAWEDAAATLGWARRLVSFYAQGRSGGQRRNPVRR